MNKSKNLVLLLSTLCLSACSCAGQPPLTSEDSKTSSDVPAVDTGKYFVQDGKSDYQIVVPSDADANVLFASSELQYFVERSTGVTLPIVKDVTLPSKEGHFFSLGSTTLWEDSGLTLAKDLGQTGYSFQTVGESLYLNSRQGSGVYCGVYDFLQEQIGLEMYTAEEIDYKEVSSIPLLSYQKEFHPLFDMRQILLKHISTNSLYERRMRLHHDLGLGKWAAFAHTTITKFLPYSKYGAAHPDWYNEGATQVCYSNPEVVVAMAEEMKNAIVGNPQATYIQMGHEDNLDMCYCASCVAEREKYGGYGGQELEFTNKLQEILDPWLHANYPERSMKYVFFAYQTSQEPPAKWNDATSSYVPISSDFRINDNVMVMYCPIDVDFSRKMSDPKNAAQHKQLQGWGDLFKYAGHSGEMYIWAYSIQAKCGLVPMNNYGVYEDHYKFYADMGATAMLDQSFYMSGVPGFEAMRAYTQAKLQYSLDVSYADLEKDFMKHYYGEAEAKIYDYYRALRAYFAHLTATQGIGAYVMSDLYLDQFWPYEVLDRFLEMLFDAEKSVEGLKATDPDRYETLLKRIRVEEIFPLYMLFRFYMNELSQKQKEQYWNLLNDACVDFGVVSSMEGSFDIATTLQTWGTSIFGA